MDTKALMRLIVRRGSECLRWLASLIGACIGVIWRPIRTYFQSLLALRRRILSFLLDLGIIYYFVHGSMYLTLIFKGKAGDLSAHNYFQFRHDIAFFNPLKLESWQWWLILGGVITLTILVRSFGRSLGQRARGLSLQNRTGERLTLGRRVVRAVMWPIAVVATPFELLFPAGRDRVSTTGLVHDRASYSSMSTYVHPEGKPRRKIWCTQWGWVTLGLLAITLVLGWMMIDASPSSLLSPSAETKNQLEGLIRPDFSHFIEPEPDKIENREGSEDQFSIRNLMFITLLMALVATILGAVIAVPLSFLGAQNLMRGSRLSKGIYTFIRGFFNLFRSIEILIWVSIFATWILYGNPFTGVMALVIHTIAALGKLYSEQVEAIDPGPLEAIRAAGGSKLQIIRYAVIPQVAPSFLAFTLYRWDINVRMATIVSLVGGGGIGELLFWYRHERNFSELGAVLLTIVVVIWALDYISGRVRERIV